MNGENGEDPSERRHRELIELLNELRVALPGVQVLLAFFLLVVPFSQRFSTVTPLQLRVYFAVLLCTAVAAVLLIAPSSHHPRRGVRVVLVRAAVASLARVASEWRSLRAPCILPNILTQKGREPSGLRPVFHPRFRLLLAKGVYQLAPSGADALRGKRARDAFGTTRGSQRTFAELPSPSLAPSVGFRRKEHREHGAREDCTSQFYRSATRDGCVG